MAVIETHDAVFRRTARRYSICADDGEDAYQRALEILLTKAPPITGISLVRWMQTVTKREALAVRRQRERLLSGGRTPGSEDEELDPLDSIASELPGPNDRAARRERVARSGEALRRLKPQEVRALTLKAEGYSYTEIGQITGWTYTKINRCMAEGRKRFLEVFAEIEEGRRCESLAGALSALADGEVGVEGAEEVHVHLRSCAGCRAKLRAFREIPDRVLELGSGAAVDQSLGGRAHEWVADHGSAFVEKVREAGLGLMTRGAAEGGSQVAATGGTRGAGMAGVGKVLAVWGVAATGGAASVATGVVDPGITGDPKEPPAPAIEKSERPIETPILESEDAPPSPTEADAAIDEQDTAPSAPEPKPAQQVSQQFGFETGAGAPAAAAPSGGEFGGPSGGGSGGGGSGGGGGGGFGFEK